MKMEKDEAWRDEDRRQSQELAEAIQKAIDDYGQRIKEAGRPPILNAVAGALVTVEGNMLASIEDPRHRKALRRAMAKALPEAVAKARITHHVETVMVGGANH